MRVVEKRYVFWLILCRLLVVSSLFISAVIIQLSTAVFLPLGPFYLIILLFYALSLVYLVLYVWEKHYGFQAGMQIIFDLLLITALVYITGGLSSSIYFLYVFAIIAAGLILSGRTTYLVASLSAILFGLLVDGLYYGIIPFFRSDQEMDLSLGIVFYTIFISWALFFVIAFLVNYLEGNLKKTREQLRLAQKELEIKEHQATAGRVSALIAHEIRNPLAAISGSVQVLKEELALNEEQRNLMSIILKESERASQSIEQFLDLASPEKHVFSMINLSEVLKETLIMFQKSGELDSRYRIEGNYEAAGIYFYGNSHQFRQIFWNLTKNALKAMPEGGVLTIDFLREKMNELKLRVADTGKGMSQEVRERIFEPFYSQFGDGRGLGMAVIQRIVEDYQGKIQVSSELEKGTEVLITLPMKTGRNKLQG
ncbi:MAG: ATP-binding protein [Candidatus Aminicenantales bacterium]